MFRVRPRAVATFALVLLASPSRADAQDARPAEPDTVGPTSAPLAPGRTLGRLPAPSMSSDGRFVVLLAGGPTAAVLDTARDRTLGSLCDQRGFARDLPPASDGEAVALGGRYLVVIVTGAQRPGDGCQIQWNISPTSIWRAAFLPAAPTARPVGEPRAARLRVDGASLTPVMAYRRPAYQRTESGWRRDGSQLRYYYEMSAIRPHPDGRSPQIAVEVWERDGAPVRFDIDPAIADRLALEHVEWKLAESASREPGARLDIRPARQLPTGMTRVLDTARTDLVAGGIGAVEWVASQQRTSDAAAVARLVAAEALLSRGEPALAQSMVAAAQRERPCLVPPAGSSPPIVELARARRDPSRCDPVSPMRAARLSLVPGMGNLAVNDRRGAIIGGGLVLGAVVRALMLDAQARQRYSEYQSARDPLEAEVLYEAVRDVRRQRGVMLGVAGTAWILDAVAAMRGAQTRAKRIADDRF